MTLAISNIAWPVEADRAVAEMLVESGVTGIEIAPTKVWSKPLEVSDAALRDYRRFWERRGLPIVAAQALLFGQPELTLFKNAETRERTFTYLCGIIRVCGQLGAKSLVFGSPKNRQRGDRTLEEVWYEAITFFTRLAEEARESGTCIVLEANPPAYGADFIITAGEAIELVQVVNHPGFRLHLDSACMTLAGDDPAAVMHTASPLLAHYHASEVNLAPLGTGSVEHTRFARSLVETRYQGWVSTEMRQPEPFDLEALRSAVRVVKAAYEPVESS